MQNKFFHSVYLDEDKCRGCINCIKRCPTQAIRVRNGKACITSEYCIDCGECVRICSHHAKRCRVDSLDILDRYKYTIALPAPSFYAQFNNLDNVNILLTALIHLGFDDVFEVGAAAELVSEASRKYVREHEDLWPIISTACPSVVRLIRVRFPNLLEHLMPLNPPVEVAATIARQLAMEKTGLASGEIGIIFISPCPSKATYVQSPLGKEISQIDGVLAAKEVYTHLLPHMKTAEKDPMDLATAGRIGIGWGCAGGEAGGLITDNYLAADGIENVMRVLEDLEDEKLQTLQFIELNACHGGCVGGVLNVENPFAAKAKLKHINKYLPVSRNYCEDVKFDAQYEWTDEVEYEPVFRLGHSLSESIAMMKRIDELCDSFPGLDCGSCGAPTCRALAEDIVRGNATQNDCIHLLRTHIHSVAMRYNKLAHDAVIHSEDASDCIYMLMHYVDNLTRDVGLLDDDIRRQYEKEGGQP